MSFYDHLLVLGYLLILCQLIIGIAWIRHSNNRGTSDFLHGRIADAEMKLMQANKGQRIDPQDMEKLMSIRHSIDEFIKITKTSPLVTFSDGGSGEKISYKISANKKSKK